VKRVMTLPLPLAAALGLALTAITLSFSGCSGRRLPPGTPPPEYEPPTVTPWPVANADAGSDANAPQGDPKPPGAAADQEGPRPLAPEPELSLDAGAR